MDKPFSVSTVEIVCDAADAKPGSQYKNMSFIQYLAFIQLKTDVKMRTLWEEY